MEQGKQHTATATEANTAGLDLGLRVLVTLSDGTMYDGMDDSWIEDLKRSGDHEFIRSMRLEIQQETATKVISHLQATGKKFLVMETLDFSGFQSQRWTDADLRRRIQNADWPTFLSLINQEAARAGITIIRLPQHTPTSRMCSQCLFTMPSAAMKLRVKVWTCPQCNVTHDRDVNAAKVIQRLGICQHAQEGVYTPQQRPGTSSGYHPTTTIQGRL